MQIHFFLLLNGTHKKTNTQNDITGTQPGTLTANDIYAGIYTEIQVGATRNHLEILDILFEMTLKWCYGTNPHQLDSFNQKQTFNIMFPAHTASL